MAGLTAASSIADALKTQAMSGVSEAIFRNQEVMGRFTRVPFTGGANLNVKLNYGGNTSVATYSEGDAAGVPGSQSYLTANFGAQYYKMGIQITGHARDQLRNGSPGAAFYNQIELEFTSGMKDLTDKISTDMLGTGLTPPVGIQGIVDSSGTLGGIAPGTYTWWAAYEAAGAATTIAISDLDGATQNSRDAEYAADITEIWVSWKQQNKLKGVIGNPGVANNSVQIQTGQNINLTGTSQPITYDGLPIIPIRDLTNSIVLGLSMPELFLGVMRDYQVDPLGKTDDSDKFLVTCAFGLGTKNRKKHWKITTLTA